jgi:hypothetical protein
MLRDSGRYGGRICIQLEYAPTVLWRLLLSAIRTAKKVNLLTPLPHGAPMPPEVQRLCLGWPPRLRD